MSEQQSRNQEWHESAKAKIEEAVKLRLYHGLPAGVSALVNDLDAQGGTEAILFEANVTLTLVAKFHTKEFQEEVDGYSRLMRGPAAFVQHMVHPLLMDASAPIWLTPKLQAETLQKLLSSRTIDSALARDLYADILSTMQHLWRSTMSSDAFPISNIYLERLDSHLYGSKSSPGVLDGLRDSFGVKDQDKLKIRIETGYTTAKFKFIELIEAAREAMGGLEASRGCTIHGDEHPGNILVKSSGNISSEDWFILDYVSARERYDWFISLARMEYWWSFYEVLDSAKNSVAIQNELRWQVSRMDDELVLSFDEEYLQRHLPADSGELRGMIRGVVDSFGQELGIPNAERERRRRVALFSVVFGSMRRHFGRWRFAVPAMMAECWKQVGA